MCGIFFAASLSGYKVNKGHVQSSIASILRRGPTHTVFREIENPSIISVNSVLAISSHADRPSNALNNADDIFLYNGELYSDYPSSLSDTDYLFHNRDLLLFTNDTSSRIAEGMYAALKYSQSSNEVHFVTDLLGEKPLFYYHDSSVLLVSSTIGAIRTYLGLAGLGPRYNLTYLREYFCTRHLISAGLTPFEGIYKAVPGRLYCFNLSTSQETTNTTQHPSLYLFRKLTERPGSEFSLKHLIESRFSRLEQKCVATVISGGIDSSLVTSLFAEWRKRYSDLQAVCSYSIDFAGKDSSVQHAPKHATSLGLEHIQLSVGVEEYAEHVIKSLQILCSPLPTHSFASQSILAERVQRDGFAILLGGEGGDEIYQGYSLYNALLSRSSNSVSPYSYYDSDLYNCLFLRESPSTGTSSKYALESFYTDILTGFNSSSTDLEIFSFLLDCTLQLSSTGLLCADQINSAYGIESRSPLVSVSALTHHFSLLSLMRDKFTPYNKKPLRELMKTLPYETVSPILSEPKAGYSGFPNEGSRHIVNSSDILEAADFIGLSAASRDAHLNTRSGEWKLLNIASFLKYV